MSCDRKWSPPEAAWEVAEAVSNLSILVYYTRNYSYEAHAISRAYHELGWLLGASVSEKEQLEMLETSLDKILARNSQRARSTPPRPPLTYEQVRAAIHTYLHSKGKPDSGLYGGEVVGMDLTRFKLSCLLKWTRTRGSEK